MDDAAYMLEAFRLYKEGTSTFLTLLKTPDRARWPSLLEQFGQAHRAFERLEPPRAWHRAFTDADRAIRAELTAMQALYNVSESFTCVGVSLEQQLVDLGMKRLDLSKDTRD